MVTTDKYRRIDGTKPPQVISASIRREADLSPDASHLGEYSNNPESEYAIDRQERGDMGRNEFRYFNPVHQNYTGCTKAEIRKYCQQDYKRMEDYNNQQWCYIGIWAEATYTVGGVLQTARSGGLWGIESDSGDSYFEEVQREQYAELRDILKDLGVKGLPTYEEVKVKGGF